MLKATGPKHQRQQAARELPTSPYIPRHCLQIAPREVRVLPSSPPLHPQHLAHVRCSINTCEMNSVNLVPLTLPCKDSKRPYRVPSTQGPPGLIQYPMTFCQLGNYPGIQDLLQPGGEAGVGDIQLPWE